MSTYSSVELREILDNPKAERVGKLRQLLEKKQRLAQSKALVEGINAVEQVIKIDGAVSDLYVDAALIETDRIAQVLSYCDEKATTQTSAPANKIWVHIATREVLDKISPDAAGILAVASLRCEIPPSNEDGPIVICNNTQDPGNAGTIIRAAVAFGCNKVIFAGNSVDHWNPKLIRSSAGAAFQTPIQSLPDLSAAIDQVKSEGYTVLAADLHGTDSTPANALWGGSNSESNNPTKLPDLDDGAESLAAIAAAANNKIAWVFGNEANGLTPAEVDLCDRAFFIPIAPASESLNLAGSVHICLAQTAQSA